MVGHSSHVLQVRPSNKSNFSKGSKGTGSHRHGLYDPSHRNPRGSTSGMWAYQTHEKWPRTQQGEEADTLTLTSVVSVGGSKAAWEETWGSGLPCWGCKGRITLKEGVSDEGCTEYRCGYSKNFISPNSWLPHLQRQRKLRACRFEAKQQEKYANILKDRDCIIVDGTRKSQKSLDDDYGFSLSHQPFVPPVDDIQKADPHKADPHKADPHKADPHKADPYIPDKRPNGFEEKKTQSTKIESSKISHWAQWLQKRQEDKYREAKYQYDRFGMYCFNDAGTGFDREKCQTEAILTEENSCRPGIELVVGRPPRDIMEPKQLMLRQRCVDGHYRAPDPPQGSGCPSDPQSTALRCSPTPPATPAGAAHRHKTASCNQFEPHSLVTPPDEIGCTACVFKSKNPDGRRAVRRLAPGVTYADTRFW